MTDAREPFRFQAASYLTRIGNQRADTLGQFLAAIEQSSDASIFHHTFQSLRRHHFLRQGFSNDFAQWVLTACNRSELAEALASLDIRDYVSLQDLRKDIHALVADYLHRVPSAAGIPSFEPFYFCEGIEVAVPMGVEVRTLAEFRQELEHIGHASFHFHFITSRLRLHLHTNDFSLWFERSLGLKNLADLANRIDIYTNTIESAQQTLIHLLGRALPHDR